METPAAMTTSITLSLVSLVILSVFITQRSLAVAAWSRLPHAVWLVFAIYSDSFLFVFATAVLHFGLGINTSAAYCESAIVLCLVFYVSTKFIYLFLGEKAYIVRGTQTPRLKSKLYLFNSFGMMGLYGAVIVLEFLFRFTRMEDGECVIGLDRLAIIPLIAFDTLVNVYLTVLFLIPLSNLYSFRNLPRTPPNVRLRNVALRTLFGCLCTLASSILNLSVLLALNGEPGWICLTCCNSDILFSAIVIQFITSKDHAASGPVSGTSGSGSANHNADDPRAWGLGLAGLPALLPSRDGRGSQGAVPAVAERRLGLGSGFVSGASDEAGGEGDAESGATSGGFGSGGLPYPCAKAYGPGEGERGADRLPGYIASEGV